MHRSISLILLLLVGAAFVSGCDRKTPVSESERQEPSKEVGKNAAAEVKAAAVVTNSVPVVEERPQTPDQKLQDEIDDASDGESRDKLLALNARVRASKDPDVREAYLNALSFYGAQAMGVMAEYLTDGNDDVANTAINHFESAIAEVEDEPIKLAAIESVFTTITRPDRLECLSGQLNIADEKLAVETIVRIVASGNEAGAKVAKESYEVVTGEAYVDAKTAEAWIKANYTPPDPE